MEHGAEELFTVEELMAGRMHAACSDHITTLDDVVRADVINKLAYERLRRKNVDIERIYTSVGDNWNQTFLIMLLRVVGGTQNREAFEQLARRVPYHVLMRENSSLANIESLLLCTSGLIELYDPEDDYIVCLKDIFVHFATKYDIKPMSVNEWNLTRIYPHNHPTLRIVQLAACIHHGHLSMQSATMCESRNDAYKLFEGAASDYWMKRFMPNADSMQLRKRIGLMKSDLLAINLIAQIQFAYGNYTLDDDLTDRAIRLLEDIPAEDNRYIKLWNCRHRTARTAYESQALIQLTTEYCMKERCAECPLAEKLTRRRGV